MNNQLSARSPFWQIVFMLHVFAFLIAYTLSNVTHSSSGTSIVFPEYIGVIFASFIAFTIWGMLSARKYNRSVRHKKVSLTQITPAELIVDDERSRVISTNATKAVYLYHNFVWPIAAIIIAITQSTPFALAIIAAVLLGHYLLYWYNIRELISEDSAK